MLDTEAEIETEVVAKLKLAPKLLVSLVSRHVRLPPDVREMSKFHACASRLGRLQSAGWPKDCVKIAVTVQSIEPISG